MEKFIIAYHGGDRPSSKEAGMEHMAKWKTWIEQLGPQVVNPGTPLMESKLITNNDVQDDLDKNSMNGFAVITAENMNAAIEIAKSDPFLSINGTIRISKMIEMK